jgi:hypothetical protein
MQLRRYSGSCLKNSYEFWPGAGVDKGAFSSLVSTRHQVPEATMRPFRSQTASVGVFARLQIRWYSRYQAMNLFTPSSIEVLG